ncbi:hypothetical protein [Rhizobium sp. 11_C7_N12_5]|uniref:hypothetical protein n=1 Tax=Rhizobium sp. 11_C7_N12_5 TaxID=3240770 RepID=UPI003F215A8E
MNDVPKYAQLENERRFLVDRCPDLSSIPSRLINDLYVEGTRLRLRAIAHGDGSSTEFKLCKKYPSDSFTSSPVVNVYLNANEYELLSKLPGRALRKRRHRLNVRETAFAIDVFEGELEGLILCEVEKATLEELKSLTLPDWVAAEVTKDPFFRGGNLSGIDAVELARKIASLPSRKNGQ